MNTSQQTVMGSSMRNLAIAAGVLYLITHVTSIGAAALYHPLLSNASYVTGTGADAQVILGAVFEIILALAIVGTSVALFPVVKKWHESIALGYVGLRTLEAGIIAFGVVPLLGAVALRQHLAADTDPATMLALSNTFVDFYRWTTLLGPGLVCGANTVLMAYLMYRSRLVPRFIPVLGLVGGPLIFALTVARMFGLVGEMSPWAGFAVIPIFAWELTLALWLISRGFNAPAAASVTTRPAAAELLNAV